MSSLSTNENFSEHAFHEHDSQLSVIKSAAGERKKQRITACWREQIGGISLDQKILIVLSLLGILINIVSGIVTQIRLKRQAIMSNLPDNNDPSSHVSHANSNQQNNIKFPASQEKRLRMSFDERIRAISFDQQVLIVLTLLLLLATLLLVLKY